MVKRILFYLLVITLLAAIPACENNNNNNKTIRIVGSTSMLPVSEMLVENFKKNHPGVQIFIQGGDSELGMRSIKNNIAEIGSLSRPLTDKEKSLVKSYIIAQDSITVIVNKKNNIKNVTIEELQQIFTGKITNWMQLGGPDAPITLISREQGSGTYNVLKDLVIGNNNEISSNASIMNSSGAVRTAVSRDKYAIGYISSAYADDSVKVLQVVDKDNNQIKLTRPLIYITSQNTKPIVKQFIKYSTSKEAKELINKILIS